MKPRRLSPSATMALAVLRGECAYPEPRLTGPADDHARSRSPWRGKRAVAPSEHGTALYTKSGAAIGARGRVS